MDENYYSKLKLIANEIQLKNSNNWIFMIPSSIGETAIILSLMNEFVFKNKIDIRKTKIIIFLHPSQICIPRYFHNKIIECYPMSLTIMRDLTKYKIINQHTFEIGKIINLWANQSHCPDIFKIHQLYCIDKSRGGLSIIDLYRFILKLDWDSRITPGLIKNHEKGMQEFCNINNIEKNNSVILFPGNNTNAPTNAGIWHEIIKKYREIGKRVFSCTTRSRFLPDSLDLSGSQQIEMPIEIAVPVINFAGEVISGQNGLICLLTLLRITARIKMILPNRIHSEETNNFIKCNPIAGSHLIQFKNENINFNNYCEYLIDEEDIDYAGIASSIFNSNQSNSILHISNSTL
jgi:hypothetical protein